jgi:hypothetical protein
MSDPLAATVVAPTTASTPTTIADTTGGVTISTSDGPSTAVSDMLADTKTESKLLTPTSATGTTAAAAAAAPRPSAPSASVSASGAVTVTPINGNGSGGNGGTNPASALVEHFKALGKKVSEECRRDGKYVSAPLAAFAARCQSMETVSTLISLVCLYFHVQCSTPTPLTGWLQYGNGNRVIWHFPTKPKQPHWQQLVVMVEHKLKLKLNL